MTLPADQAFLEIGRHCSEQSCRQLDFLPFKCPSCQLPFCSQHWRPPSGHSCSQYDLTLYDNRVPSCPLCSTPVPIPPSTDPNVSMDRHLSLACAVLNPTLAAAKVAGSPATTNECQAARCRVKLIVEIRCDECGGKFCPSHRYGRDHRCRGTNPRSNDDDDDDDERGNVKASTAAKRTNGFASLFGSSVASASSTSGPSKGVNKGPGARDRSTGPGLSGLAALRRAQQALGSSTSRGRPALNPTAAAAGTSANRLVLESSDSDVEIVSKSASQSNPSSRKPVATSTTSTPRTLNQKKDTSTPSLVPASLSKTSRRAKAEQASQRQALEVRAKKGLLTEDEKVRYATLQALEAKRGGGDSAGGDACRIA
ncbi:hypothetical protein JCM10212_002254 [Sporobolomyces blumeae]